MIAEQLKKSILQAAIQGKLTERLPEDGDARDLLKEIQKEKQRLIKEGKIKKEKQLPEIAEEEIPFDIPVNWCWVRLGEVGSSFSDGVHFAPKYYASGVPCISAKDIYNDMINFDRCNYISEADYQSMREKINIQEGSLLFTKSGSIGRTCTVDGNQRFGLVESVGVINLIAVKQTYVKCIFDLIFDGTGVSNQYTQGIGVKHLTLALVRNILVPLPPLFEQHRIVDRLEEILPTIDKLARDETKLDELLQTFPKKMKDAVLQAAIQGKLTEQLPEDGDARDLLKEIQKEKEKLIREGKIKKEKPLPEIIEDEIPFEIPANWCWVRLNYVCQYIHRGKTPKYSVIQKYPVVAQKCNQWDGFHIEKAQFIDPHSVGKYPQEQALINEDILWNSTGLGTLGRVAIYDAMNNPYGFAVADSHVTVLRTLKHLVLPKFVFSCLAGPWVQGMVESISTGSTKQKELGTETIRRILLPIPPLSEQHRIIKKLEKVLPMCEVSY